MIYEVSIYWIIFFISMKLHISCACFSSIFSEISYISKFSRFFIDLILVLTKSYFLQFFHLVRIRYRSSILFKIRNRARNIIFMSIRRRSLYGILMCESLRKFLNEMKIYQVLMYTDFCPPPPSPRYLICLFLISYTIDFSPSTITLAYSFFKFLQKICIKKRMDVYVHVIDTSTTRAIENIKWYDSKIFSIHRSMISTVKISYLIILYHFTIGKFAKWWNYFDFTLKNSFSIILLWMSSNQNVWDSSFTGNVSLSKRVRIFSSDIIWRKFFSTYVS